MIENVTQLKPKEEIEVPLTLRGASQLVEKRRHGSKEPDGTFDLLSETAASITEAAEKIKTSVTAILGNQMATPIKNTAMAKKAAEKVWDRVAPRLDAVHQKAKAKIEELEASTLPPTPKNAMDSMLHAEVRDALRHMPPEERGKAIRAAIDADDDTFVAAACTGSSVLTGLGRAEQQFLLGQWQRKRHGPTMDRIARLKDGLQQFDDLGSMFLGWSLSLLSDNNAAIAAAELSEKLAREAMDDVS